MLHFGGGVVVFGFLRFLLSHSFASVITERSTRRVRKQAQTTDTDN